jgi:hypothetical protein
MIVEKSDLTGGRGGKLYFKNQQRRCMGRDGTGDCNICIRTFPHIALGCSNLGEYLPKKDWNKTFKNSPLYNRDIKARHAFDEQFGDKNKTVSYDSSGMPIGRNGC